jgi:hypothetical protein
MAKKERDPVCNRIANCTGVDECIWLRVSGTAPVDGPIEPGEPFRS